MKREMGYRQHYLLLELLTYTRGWGGLALTQGSLLRASWQQSVHENTVAPFLDSLATSLSLRLYTVFLPVEGGPIYAFRQLVPSIRRPSSYCVSK